MPEGGQKYVVRTNDCASLRVSTRDKDKVMWFAEQFGMTITEAIYRPLKIAFAPMMKETRGGQIGTLISENFKKWNFYLQKPEMPKLLSLKTIYQLLFIE